MQDRAFARLSGLTGTWDAQGTSVTEEWNQSNEDRIIVDIIDHGGAEPTRSGQLFFGFEGDSLLMRDRDTDTDEGRRFRLDSYTDDVLVFRNTRPGFPYFIAYYLLENGEMRVRAWAEKGEAQKEYVIVYRRLP